MDVGRGIVRRAPYDVPQIAPIHRKDQVETVEIVLGQLPRALGGNIDAVAACDGDRTMVRGIAVMPSSGSRRSGLDQMRQATLGGMMPQQALAKRGAADIAEADEEDSSFFHAKA
jgi:hypothetical protein